MVGFLWIYAIWYGFFCRAYAYWHEPRACAFWHGFRLTWLMPFGMVKVNIANMTLFKLYQGLGIQKVFPHWHHVFCFLCMGSPANSSLHSLPRTPSAGIISSAQSKIGVEAAPSRYCSWQRVSVICYSEFFATCFTSSAAAADSSVLHCSRWPQQRLARENGWPGGQRRRPPAGGGRSGSGLQLQLPPERLRAGGQSVGLLQAAVCIRRPHASRGSGRLLARSESSSRRKLQAMKSLHESVVLGLDGMQQEWPGTRAADEICTKMQPHTKKYAIITYNL